jgi:hypothetical protein
MQPNAGGGFLIVHPRALPDVIELQVNQRPMRIEPKSLGGLVGGCALFCLLCLKARCNDEP